jgi:S1-C subfamily serine protease
MKTKRTFLLTICFALCAAFAFAQNSEEAELYISKQVRETDGSFSSETITKKGKAATEFNIDEYVKNNKADNVDLVINLTGGDEERSITLRGSNGPRKSGYYEENDININIDGPAFARVTGNVNRALADINRAGRNFSFAGDNYSFNDNDDAFLGVEEDSDEDEDKEGVVVDITRNSAADKAGLRNNDLILKLNDTKVDKWEDITKFMEKAQKGDKVKVTYRRNGKEATTEAELTNRWATTTYGCDNQKRGYLGVSEFGDIEDEPGVRIAVTKKSAVEKAGLKKGDVILQLDDAEINDFEDIEDFMDAVKPGDKIKIKYKRDGKTETLEATAGEQQSWNWDASGWEGGQIDIETKQGCLGICNNNAKVGSHLGAAIVNMACASPAKLAGLQNGDLIVEINGVPVNNGNDLWQELVKYAPNTTIGLSYVRDGKELLTDATLNACGDAYEAVTMTSVDDWGNARTRKFYTWNMDDEDEEQLRTRQTIAIHRAADSDVPVFDPINHNESGPVVTDRTLEFEDFQIDKTGTNGHLTLTFETAAKATIVRILDLSGRQLFLEELNVFNGNYRQTFDLTEMSQNDVLIHVQQGEKAYFQEVFVD